MTLNFKLIVYLALFIIASKAAFYNYPVKSVNLDKAPSVEWYTGSNAEQAGLSPVADIHPVHGVQTQDGGFVIVGKGLEYEGSSTEEAFAIKLSSSGSFQWSWRSNHGGKDVANAVDKIDNDLFIVGYRVIGGVAKRSLTKINGDNGNEVWTTTDFGDSGSSGAWEMIKVASDSNVYLSGFKNKNSLDEMSFKSYGNVPQGTAVVSKLSQDKLKSSNTPVSSDIMWNSEFSSYVTAKAVELLGGSSVVVLFWSESEQAGLVKLNADSGATQWGPQNHGSAHGEGTDIAVSSDGSVIAISGQGGSSSPKTIAGRMTLVNGDSGSRISTKSYESGGDETIIFNECWGVSTMPDNGGFTMACGTGIEGGHCYTLSGDARSKCLEGKGDPRDGAVPRKENIWQAMTVRIDKDGNLMWQRVDSYRGSDQPESTSHADYEASSSAAEWAIVNSDGSFAIVTDEVFGAGVLKLGKYGILNLFNVLIFLLFIISFISL